MDDAGERVLTLSALKGKGVGQVERLLLSAAHPGQWRFSAGVTTDRSQEEQTNEIVREMAFQYLNQVRERGGYEG